MNYLAENLLFYGFSAGNSLDALTGGPTLYKENGR